MAEKVLGFKEKDVVELLDNWCGRFDDTELPQEVAKFLHEEQDKLVLVVSLEWLKTQLELLLARSVWEMLPARIAELSFKQPYNLGVKETEECWHNIITDLLLAAEKEAKK